MKGLSIEQVEHVADLANLFLTDDEKGKFSHQLQDILTDIDKITAIEEHENDSMLIAPTFNHDLYHEDEVKESLEIKDILKNANETSGDYISVPKAIHD